MGAASPIHESSENGAGGCSPAALVVGRATSGAVGGEVVLTVAVVVLRGRPPAPRCGPGSGADSGEGVDIESAEEVPVATA